MQNAQAELQLISDSETMRFGGRHNSQLRRRPMKSTLGDSQGFANLRADSMDIENRQTGRSCRPRASSLDEDFHKIKSNI
jgi:hypothetical protein